jgi:DNA helicase HerA-like ATPase
MEKCGVVVSTIDSPSSRKFSFVIDKGKTVKRGQFVQVNTPAGGLVARISDVLKTNRYFNRPESVKEYESSGKSMNEIFPVDDWEYLIAEAYAFGVHTEGGFLESLVPPSPGESVFEPKPDIMQRFFGLDENGLSIGKIPHHNINVKLNPTRFLQKHLAILAISGAGKSFLTSVIIEELLNRKAEQGQLSIILIDTHGEYTSFADDPSFSGKTSVFPVSEIQIGLPNLSPYEMTKFMSKPSDAQVRELFKVITKLGNKSYGISDLISKVESSEIAMKTKEVLVSSLESLRYMRIFGVADYPSLEDLVRQGHLSIIDLSDTINLKKKQMIVAYIASKLFKARRNGIVPPFLLILEEAHQYVPEGTKSVEAISRGIITTIAREGRKFGSSLCLISQRPIQLSTTVLSQCNTHVIMRITNPYDLDHIGKSSEGITSPVLKQISSLRVGSGLIVGEAVNYPIFVDIRKRKSKESSKSLPLEQAAIEYHKKMQKKTKDAKEFM